MTQLLIGGGLVLAVVALLVGFYWYAGRQGRKVSEGEQAKQAIKVATDIAKVPQPLPGEAESRLDREGF